jgi:hypothetical protein
MLSNGRARDADTTTMARYNSEAGPTLKQRAATTTQRLSQTAHAAGERAKAVGEHARHQADRVRGGYEYLLHEQPLALGAIGLALGVVLAGAAPRTRQEDELMGDASDRLETDLRDAGREQLDKARRAASAAKDAAEDSLYHDGLDADGRIGNPPSMVRPPIDFRTP